MLEIKNYKKLEGLKFGEWMDMSRVGSYTKEWAHSIIEDDKAVNSTKVRYYILMMERICGKSTLCIILSVYE